MSDDLAAAVKHTCSSHKTDAVDMYCIQPLLMDKQGVTLTAPL